MQYVTFHTWEDMNLPKRNPDGHKGTFGKLLIIAGSPQICGAALLAGSAALRTGVGMVRIVTAIENRQTLQQALPEALLTVYDVSKWQDGMPDAAFANAFAEALSWADGIVAGPGLGTGETARWLFAQTLASNLPLVLDADGLNLLSEMTYTFPAERQVILTPHRVEFARLYGCSAEEATENLPEYTQRLADRLQAVIVSKDAKTLVAEPGATKLYRNESGNDGMATAGSGDVLSGIIGALLLLYSKTDTALVGDGSGHDDGAAFSMTSGPADDVLAVSAARAGVFLHGLAGDAAATKKGRAGMVASDIIDGLTALWAEHDMTSSATSEIMPEVTQQISSNAKHKITSKIIRKTESTTMTEIMQNTKYCNKEYQDSCKRVYAEIDLDALHQNLEEMHRLLPEKTGIMAVLKADGYGHGALPISRALEDVPYVWGYAVATAEEAVELRDGGVHKPILVLGYTFPDSYEELLRRDVQLTVFRVDTLAELSACAAALGTTAKVHIKVDTGMNRIGIRPDETGLSFVGKVLADEHLQAEGIFTHLARADEADKTAAKEQIDRFSQFVSQAEGKYAFHFPKKHCANSAGILELRESDMDLARAGIILYGLWPSDEVGRDGISLAPLLSLKSHIVYCKEIKAGEPVSYGGTFTAPKDMRVATVPVGYGDGYPRSLSNQGYVLIRGKRAPILGRVCMDQLMVSVEDIPDAAEGDTVTLIGRDGAETITMEELGRLSGRFTYELACCLNKRIPRIYHHGADDKSRPPG